LEVVGGLTVLFPCGERSWWVCQAGFVIITPGRPTSKLPLLEQAFALFQARTDKTWSFTDCLSFQIMGQRGILLALTGDRHFRQAGFQTAFNAADR